MVKARVKIVIDNVAKKQLKEAYKYIRKDSPQNAEKVKAKILESFNKLGEKPAVHTPDKYRLNNDGSFRAYEIYKYRISYQVTETQINIIRVRHTKMNPKEY